MQNPHSILTATILSGLAFKLWTAVVVTYYFCQLSFRSNIQDYVKMESTKVWIAQNQVKKRKL